MKEEVVIYTISDSLGETSQKLVSAVMVQYPEVIFSNTYRFPFVNQESELLDILADALKDKAIVVSTLVDTDLARLAQEFSQRTGLSYLDLMTPFFSAIRAKTGCLPIEQPGLVHKLDSEYFNRISAIEFAVKYDDGKNPRGFLDSDLVLLGVSRTSKTPLSMYLANKGYKVSNLPLIPEVPLPTILDKVEKQKLLGLVCQPEKLSKIRHNRLESLGLTHATNYVDIEKIKQELQYSRKVFERLHIPVIDVTDKSIEEMAYHVEEYLKGKEPSQ